MSTLTGSKSMNYNSVNTRGKFKRQQKYVVDKVDTLTITSDYARLTLYSNVINVGIDWSDVPFPINETSGTGPANIFNSTDRKGLYTTLAVKGSKWELVNNETALKYKGDSNIIQLYGYVSFTPTEDDYSLSRTMVPGSGGSGYTVNENPAVTFSGGTGGSVNPIVTGIVDNGAVVGFNFTSLEVDLRKMIL